MDQKDQGKQVRVPMVKQAWRGDAQAHATIDVVRQLPDDLRALFWDILVDRGEPLPLLATTSMPMSKPLPL